MNTGERMKERRKALGLSAENVAERLGVSPATVYRYENGDIEKMPGNILGPIASILQTTPAYLMGWDESHAPLSIPTDVISADERRLITLYRRADEIDRTTIRNILSRYEEEGAVSSAG